MKRIRTATTEADGYQNELEPVDAKWTARGGRVAGRAGEISSSVEGSQQIAFEKPAKSDARQSFAPPPKQEISTDSISPVRHIGRGSRCGAGVAQYMPGEYLSAASSENVLRAHFLAIRAISEVAGRGSADGARQFAVGGARGDRPIQPDDDWGRRGDRDRVGLAYAVWSGLKGFAKYSGVSITEDMTGEFFGTFLVPSLMHQDPHYHREPYLPIPQESCMRLCRWYGRRAIRGSRCSIMPMLWAELRQRW